MRSRGLMCVPATLLLSVIGIFLVGLSILFGILYITLALTNKIANRTFILNLLKISLILFILTVIAAAVVMLAVENEVHVKAAHRVRNESFLTLI